MNILKNNVNYKCILFVQNTFCSKKNFNRIFIISRFTHDKYLKLYR